MTAMLAPSTSFGSSRSSARQMASFAAIGIVSTAAYVGLYAALRAVWSAGAANAAALLVTAVGNTAANRRYTFEVRGRRGLARDHATGLLALVAALAVTSVSLAALDAMAPHPGRLTEIAVLVAANAAATLTRFLLLRLAMSRSGIAASPAVSAAAPPDASPALPAACADPTAYPRPRPVPPSGSGPALATLSTSERTRG